MRFKKGITEKMNFDMTIKEHLQDTKCIDYGVLCGNEKIVFIKSGRGGTHIGYDDKYLKMAMRLNSNQHCTVICSSNPIEVEKSYDVDKRVIERYIAQKRFSNFEVCLVGASNGAYQNLFLANQLLNVKKILCVNMPIMINFHKSSRALQALTTVEKFFVYGAKDPSYAYIPMLEMKKYPFFHMIRVDEADHQFKNKTEEFIALADFI